MTFASDHKPKIRSHPEWAQSPEQAFTPHSHGRGRQDCYKHHFIKWENKSQRSKGKSFSFLLKLQKTQLKTIQMYYLSVLEVRESKTGLTGLKSKYPHSWVPFSLGGGGTAVMLWRRMFPCLFKRLLYAGSFTSVLSDFLRLYGLYPTKLLCPWESPDKNTGVGCRALLQGIFLTQGWNPHLCLLCSLHWQMGSLSLAPPRKPPKMLIAQCAWFLDCSVGCFANHGL